MKTKITAMLFLPLILAAAPVYEWKFDKANGNKIVASQLEKNVSMWGKLNESGGVRCNTKDVCRTGFFPPKYEDFTVNVKFKLDSDKRSRGGNTIFAVAFHSWNRRQMSLAVTPGNELLFEYRNVDLANTKKIIKSLKCKSAKLVFEANREYHVTLTSKTKGDLKIYLDGKLVAGTTDSIGFNDGYIGKIPAGYPLLYLGRDPRYPEVIARPLNGTITYLRIEKGIKEPVVKADTAGHLLITDDSLKNFSTPFQLPDRPGKMLGSFVRPEEKFIKGAATVACELKNDILTVKFHCPVAEGTKIVSNRSLWSNDNVEFFVRPDITKPVYYHYAADAKGNTYAEKCEGQNRKINSKFTVEAVVKKDSFDIEMKIPVSEFAAVPITDGTLMTANFNRYGKTSGGSSGWKLTGASHHNIEAFGKIVFGSRKAYFMKKIADAEKRFASIKAPENKRAEVKKQLENLKKAVASKGDDAKSFDLLEHEFEKVDTAFIQLALAGKSILIWKTDTLSNMIRPGMTATALTAVKDSMPLNTMIKIPVVISNLTDKPFMGQLKATASDAAARIKDFRRLPQNELTKAVKLYHSLELKNESETVNYDPVVPLHLNTLVTIPAYSNIIVYIEIDSSKLSVGKHSAVMLLKPSYANFTLEKFNLEIDVKNVDLGKVHCDLFNYTHAHYRTNGVNDILRFLVKANQNMIFMGVPGQLKLYPTVNSDGSIGKCDFRKYDSMIDAYIAAGMPLKRIKLLFFLAWDYGWTFKGCSLFHKNFPKAAKSYLAELTSHIQKKYSIGLDRIIFYTVDEPSGKIADKKSSMYKAWYSAKIIKEANPKYLTMTNPLPRQLAKGIDDDLPELMKYYDIIEIYRPQYTAKLGQTLLKNKKTIWTYGIYGVSVSPAVYRADLWKNMRDGATSVAPYWHLEDNAGGDGFCNIDGERSRADYGTLFIDYNYGTVVSSRRFEAHRQGFEDYRLFRYCKDRIKKGSAAEKKLLDIVRRGAAGDMAAMDKCRLEMLNLAVQL